jgi:uridine kinase
MITNSSNGTLLIGIAGASGSGKTFFAEKLNNVLTPQNVCILSQDYYYKDRSQIPFKDRALMNYDHPDAIDFDLLEEHLILLKNGRSVDHPIYDFKLHNRINKKKSVGPVDIILLDGILIYAVERMMHLFDYKVYIDAPMDVCFIRRLQRDTKERGRTAESVIEQYLDTVRPMFLKFVLPSKNKADFVIKGQGDVLEKVNYLIDKIDQ